MLPGICTAGTGRGSAGAGPPGASPAAAAPGRRERQYDTAWTATRLRRHASEDTGPGPGIENFLGKRAPETPGHRREGNVQRALFPVHMGPRSRRARRTAMKTMTKRSWCRIPTLAGSQTTNVYPDKSRSGLEVWSSGIHNSGFTFQDPIVRITRGDRGFAAPFDFGKITQQSRTHAGQYDYMTAVSTCIV